MMGISMLRTLLALLNSSLSSPKSRRALAVENLVLRQQLAVYEREVRRRKLTRADRAFWLALMQWWPKWRAALIIVKPETVIAWHRKGFRLFGRGKVAGEGGDRRSMPKSGPSFARWPNRTVGAPPESMASC